MADVRLDQNNDNGWELPYQGPVFQEMPPGTYHPGGYEAPAAPPSAPPQGGQEYRNWLGAQYHTPEDILKNYWAPDWKEVFMSPSRWGASAPAAAAPSPFNINSFGQGWVGSGGSTLQDWLNYWGAHPEAGQAGAKLSGSKQDKLEYNGRIYDMVRASGLGGQGATFSDVTNPGPSMPASSYSAMFNEQSTANLEKYVNELIAQLKQPAYTGAESEVLRTRALEPIERDRSAAHQRALQNIGSRGFDPTSGIAQELLGQVDRGFDAQRGQAQNDLAYKQINEQRQRQTDVLNLLGLLYQLPNNAMNQALNVLQAGGNANSLFSNYAQLGAMNNANSAANGSWLGQLLAYLMGQH